MIGSSLYYNGSSRYNISRPRGTWVACTTRPTVIQCHLSEAAARACLRATAACSD
jgi:hypothetical protein